MNKQPIGLDSGTYLATLVTDPGQVISPVYAMDGAGLYRINDDHYVSVVCIRCKHRGQALLERVLPRDWECFHSGVNVEDGFEVYHYGPSDSPDAQNPLPRTPVGPVA